MRSRLRRFGPAVAAFSTVYLAACASHPASLRESQDGRVITRDQIARSGARDAWEALRRNSGHLLIRQNSRDEQTRVSARGHSSILLNNEILFVVDGVQLVDGQYLREIPAATVAFIQILSAPQGTVRYGTPAGNGVVVVRTDPGGGE